MRAYIIRRLLLLIPTLFFLTILVFLALRFIPGDVIDAMIGIGGGYFGGDFETSTRARPSYALSDWTLPCTCSTCAGWAA